ncbi:MAG: hypothetical protein WCW27_04815 [Patescibacteria group bacterium]|jgi:hypothetical protein
MFAKNTTLRVGYEALYRGPMLGVKTKDCLPSETIVVIQKIIEQQAQVKKYSRNNKQPVFVVSIDQLEWR